MTLTTKPITRRSPTTERNFGLTEEQFFEMISKMKLGDENLFEKIFLAHFSDCMSFLKKNYNISHELAYDISMDTLLTFRQGLFHDKYSYGNLRFLFTRMATQLLFKEKKKSAKVTAMEESIEIEEELTINNDEELKFLELAWKNLDEKSQSILKLFYFDKMKLTEIAKLKNKSHSAVRKQKERSIIALKKNYHLFSNPSINRL